MLLCFWIFIAVPSSLLQPSLLLSLPVRMSINSPSWQFLPLSQAEIGPLFSNFSPFSFSQSLFMVPPSTWGPRPGLQASFGPYSVTQLIPETVLPLPPSLSAYLLSEHVEKERDAGGHERFRVRTLFHKHSDTSTQKTCITLHAFRETEEHKASCITQPPLGLCVVTLTLPSEWFKNLHGNQPYQDLDRWNSDIQPQLRGHHYGKYVNRQHAISPSLRYHPGIDEDTRAHVPQALRDPRRNHIQLYYSSFNTEAKPKLTPSGCLKDQAAHSQRFLFPIKAVTLKEEERGLSRNKEEEACFNGQEEEELSLDSHVVIRYHRGPTLIGQPIKMSVNLRSNFSSEFVVIRLKVKKGLVSMVAQKTLTSDLWTVTLERSHGSKHDMVSILCHKHSTIAHTHDPSLLQQVVCLSIDGLRQSFSLAMTVSANWSVEYSGHINNPSPHEAAVTMFSFADRQIFGIAPITESNMIINTAILTKKPVSIPVIVLAISHDGKMSDVTSAVTCHSTNKDTVKVSSDCSTLFVDGSESGLGNTCAVVEFLLGMLSGTVCLEVWAPSVPLQMSLSDPILNAISGWNHFTKNGCAPVYQRSSVQVLTQFTARDSHSRTIHLLGSSDWFVDVTELVHDQLRIKDSQVASLGTQNNVIGLQPGKTSLHVISEHWDGELGRCDIIVTSDPVTPTDLSVQVVSGLGMSVTSSYTHPSIVTTTVTAYNIMYNHHQEATISVWLQFSDDTATLLSFFSDLPSFLHLFSLAQTVVVVTPGPMQRIFAQGDGGGPLLQAELLVSTCTDQPTTSNFISEGNIDWTDTGEEGWTRKLARGSGWIRVNLDLGFLQPEGSKSEEDEEFDNSRTLIESDSDIYSLNFDMDDSGTESNDYDDITRRRNINRKWNMLKNRGIVSQNNLERAVLKPSQEEGTVYISPSLEKDRKGDWHGGRELEVGVGTVLSLLCLSTVLFLANCLPCALRDRRRVMAEEDGVGELAGEAQAEEEEKRKNRENEDKIKQQQEEQYVKEVEIIC